MTKRRTVKVRHSRKGFISQRLLPIYLVYLGFGYFCTRVSIDFIPLLLAGDASQFTRAEAVSFDVFIGLCFVGGGVICPIGAVGAWTLKARISIDSLCIESAIRRRCHPWTDIERIAIASPQGTRASVVATIYLVGGKQDMVQTGFFRNAEEIDLSIVDVAHHHGIEVDREYVEDYYGESAQHWVVSE